MLEWIALFSLITGFILLTGLAAIDFKTGFLPNEMVAAFAAAGLVFHVSTTASYISPIDIALGALTGFLSLYVLRLAANRLYKDDALGLGDVKLMGAGGIWLGMHGILLAMTIGAIAGMLHGVIAGFMQSRKQKEKTTLLNLQIPAGPGFAVGLIVAACYVLRELSLFAGQGL